MRETDGYIYSAILDDEEREERSISIHYSDVNTPPSHRIPFLLVNLTIEQAKELYMALQDAIDAHTESTR